MYIPSKQHVDSINSEEVVDKGLESVDKGKSDDENKATEKNSDMDEEEDASDDIVPEAKVDTKATSKRKTAPLAKKR